MTLVALVLSLFVATVGAVGLAAPARFIGVVRHFQTPAGLYFAAARWPLPFRSSTRAVGPGIVRRR